MRLILASASPARLMTLHGAGVFPDVVVSGVDEDAIVAAARSTDPQLGPADIPLLLARAKAEAVDQTDPVGDLILGCDSVFELDGQIHGKPGSAAAARERLTVMSGRTGSLHTGHWLINRRTGASVGRTGTAEVSMAQMSAAEIDAYVASGEPMEVAGSFTIDGLGGPFITGIVGDPHCVVGVSLPVLRELLADLGIAMTQLWDIDRWRARQH